MWMCIYRHLYCIYILCAFGNLPAPRCYEMNLSQLYCDIIYPYLAVKFDTRHIILRGNIGILSFLQYGKSILGLNLHIMAGD